MPSKPEFLSQCAALGKVALVALAIATIASPAFARSMNPPQPSPNPTPAGRRLPLSATSTSFSNPAAITIPDATGFGDINTVGVATPYPSTIAVAGLVGLTSKVTVTLSDINHTFFGDVDVVLVSPTGQSLVLTAVNGGVQPPGSFTLTFDDAGPPMLGLGSPVVSGTYHPTDGDICAWYSDCTPANQAYPAPGPSARPVTTSLAAFNQASPNGTWNLYAIDRGVGDIGSISSGWSLSIDTYPVTNVSTAIGYPTIQGAIADPLTVDGNVIAVSAGTYNERVTMTKSLSILGAGEASTILDGTGLPGVGSGIVINTGLTNVTIKDLTVRKYAGNAPNSYAGIYGVGGNSGLTVQNVTLKDNVGGCGFYANGPVNGITLDNLDVSGHTNAFGAARGIVVWNGLKQNISITNCDVYNNNCCGIELQDGTASGVTLANNNIHDNGDNGIGVVGLEGPGENVIQLNTLTNNGRFGIEVKNPNGSGAVAGPGRVVVENNTVSRTTPIGDARDIMGIAAFRRGVLAGNVNIPNGAVIRNNIVSGYTQPSVSEGFGIVAEGTNHSVTGNTVSGCDVGIQRQAGHLPYPGDGDQSNVADQYFGRGNSPTSCDIAVSGNILSNSVDTRDVPLSAGGVSSATLTTTIVGNGTVTKSPDQPAYGCGTTVTVTLTAVADLDWHFTGWSGDASGNTNPLTVIMTGNKSITATFAPNAHVNVVLDRNRATASSTGVSTAQQYVGQGSWHEVYPSAKAELYIVPSFDLAGASFTVNDIQAITYHTRNHANVMPTDFALYLYTAGSAHGFYEQRLTAEPYLKTSQPYTPVLDTWQQWSTTGADQLTFNDTNNSGNFGFYTQPTLSQIQAGPIQWSTWPGNPGPGANATPINYGPQSVKYVSFQTGSGWSAFDGYLDGISIALKTGTTYDVDLEAFPYFLTVNTVGNGSVAKSPDQPSYAPNTVVQLTATGDPGWHFVSWSGDATGNTNPYNLTMNSDKTVTATFEIDVLSIFASAGPGGTIVPSGTVPVTYGSSQSFTIAPNACYMISDVLVDGGSVGAVASYTFTNVTTNHTIASSFVQIPVAAVTGLVANQLTVGNDTDGTTKITLTFSAPGAASVEVWRRGFGSYPTYDDGGGSAPTLPGSYPPAGWTWVTSVTASGQTDEPASRDFWYYVAYAKDACGNVSGVSSMTGGTLNYHLGDVSNGTPGSGDNSVGTLDISLLGMHYGLTGVALAGFEYLDVGPTTTTTTSGRPTTDSKTNFEDLVLFALNYTPTVSALARVGVTTEAVDALSVNGPAEVHAGDMFDVAVDLAAGGNLQALSLALGWNARVVEPIDMLPGELVTNAGGVVFSPGPGRADAAMLGTGNTIAGHGTLATVRFRAIASGSPGISIVKADGRGTANQQIEVKNQNPVAIEAAVRVTDLQSVIPTPSLGSATLQYSLASSGRVELAVYSVDGRLVKSLEHDVKAAGRYTARWDGRDDRGASVKAGIYFVRLVSPSYQKTRTITLLK